MPVRNETFKPTVVAGPEGFYGSAFADMFFGDLRPEKDLAMRDAEIGFQLAVDAGFAGLQAARALTHENHPTNREVP